MYLKKISVNFAAALLTVALPSVWQSTVPRGFSDSTSPEQIGLSHGSDLVEAENVYAGLMPPAALLPVSLYVQEKSLKPGQNATGFIEKESDGSIWLRSGKCDKAGRWEFWKGSLFSRCTLRGETVYAKGNYVKQELGEEDCCGAKRMRVRVIQR